MAGANWKALLAAQETLPDLTAAGVQIDDHHQKHTVHHQLLVVAWRAMRDGYYDANLGNRNWDEIRRKYIDAAAAATDDTAFARVVSLMLGELNGSHLGFSGRGSRGGPDPDLQWNELTGHLGLRYDPNYKGPGWLVKDVIEGGPASEAEVGIQAGDVVLAIDGTTVDPSMPVESVLTGFHARDIAVRVRRGDAEPREVTLRPTTYAGIRRMLYSRWIEGNQKVVEEQTDGRLGYLHIRGMNWSSFLKFELELFKVGHNKDGLIIDVRANGGGSTADHLLTVLTQPQHAITVPRGGGRGYPQDRRVYATWHKPIVVLCDQDSFSNAEIFAHAIKTLGRGRLVGMPTAGGVISTGRAGVMDLGSIRMPFRGWYVLDGQDMELNGAMPHFLVPRQPGEWPSGQDGQLAKAIAVLQEDVAEYQARPQPELVPSSERGASPVREIRNSKTREKHQRERRVRF
ncbi:MAG: S41 family peptidase [Planctomycetota bacterium]